MSLNVFEKSLLEFFMSILQLIFGQKATGKDMLNLIQKICKKLLKKIKGPSGLCSGLHYNIGYR